MSKITTNDIIDLAGIEAEIARLEAVNNELSKLSAEAKTDAASIKNALKGIGSSASELGKIQTQAKKANAGFKSLKQELNGNNAKLKKLKAELKGVKRELDKFKKSTDGASNSQRKFRKSTNAATSSLKRWIGGLIGYHLVERFASSVVKLGIEMDRLKFTYKTILTRQGELDRAWRFTSKLANDYGISIIEVRDSFIKFRAAADAAGISASGTEEMFDTFTKTSAVLGLSTEKAGLALRALSQIAAKGTVQMEELRGQLGEQIPGAVSLMAEGMGIGLGQFEKMVANGEILSKDALPALAKQMKVTFNLNTIDRIDTAQTAVGRLTTAYAEFTEALDSGEAVKIFAKGLTILIKTLTNNVEAILSVVKAAAYIVPAFLGIITVTKAATAATRLLNKALLLNPYVAVAVAVGVLAKALYDLEKNSIASRRRFEEETRVISENESRMKELAVVIHDVTSNEVARFNAIQELNKIAPDLISDIDDEKEALKETTKAIDEYTSAESRRARVMELSRQMGELGDREQELREGGTLLNKTEAFIAKYSQGPLRDIFGAETIDEQLTTIVKARLKIGEEIGKLQTETPFDDGSGLTVDGDYKKDKKTKKGLTELQLRAKRIELMRKGLKKELALNKLAFDKEKEKFKGHKDILLGLEKKYQRERYAILSQSQTPEGIRGFTDLPESLSPKTPGPFDNTPEKDKADFLGRAAQIGLDGAKDLKNLEDVEERKKKIRKEATDFAMKQIKKLADYQLQIAEEELRRADQKVQTATAELNAQVALADAGYAANVGNAQRNLQLEKDNQKKALADKKKAQKAQLAIDAATQVSNLITATTAIWKRAGDKGVIIGPALAIAATALMWGSFAAAQVGALKAVNKQKYGKGGLEIIKGGTHASGNDTPLGFSVNGREAYGEKGEAHMIVSAKNTRRYKNLLPEIEKGLNSGTFESMLNANISPIINSGTNVDMSRTERHLRDIKNQGERQRFVDKDGNIVESYKNLTVRYK